MCGIGGWIGDNVGVEQIAGRFIGAMRHRGPDDYGVHTCENATLVHTRLSIIDLSPAGHQPIANEDKTVWAVFNGEIYNHRDLRSDLEKQGHKFVGRSDSEVLVHLYEEHGASFLSQLRGMFALGIYDTKNRTLLLARDRFGIKPLFFAPTSSRLAFASEIQALLGLPGVDAQPNRQAIYDFAALLYIPAPETFYRGIVNLQPGELLEARWEARGVSWSTRQYHRWTIAPDLGLRLSDAADKAEKLLDSAVRRQLEADVPIGTLLSGGIDSSLVSYYAQARSRNGIQTFNVRFPEKDFDETWAALAVADSIKSHHTTLSFDRHGGTWKEITELLCHAGQPFADTSLFATNGVARLMRQHVTVALAGDGGDEAFGGYGAYWRVARIANLQRFPPVAWHFAGAMFAPLVGLGIVPGRIPLRINDLSDADDVDVVANLFCVLREDEQRRLCLDTQLLPLRRWFEPQWQHCLPSGVSRLERLSALVTEANVRLQLANDFLFKVDTASMKESLEVRVPLLDEDLFAYGLTLPHRLKMRGRMGKQVLRAIAGRHLPDAVAKKEKKGFSIPLETWVDDDFKQKLRETLLGRSAKISEFFNSRVYEPMVRAFCDGSSNGKRIPTHLIFMLLSVELTLRSKDCFETKCRTKDAAGLVV